jgi:hypothetical protein
MATKALVLKVPLTYTPTADDVLQVSLVALGVVIKPYRYGRWCKSLHTYILTHKADSVHIVVQVHNTGGQRQSAPRSGPQGAATVTQRHYAPSLTGNTHELSVRIVTLLRNSMGGSIFSAAAPPFAWLAGQRDLETSGRPLHCRHACQSRTCEVEGASHPALAALALRPWQSVADTVLNQPAPHIHENHPSLVGREVRTPRSLEGSFSRQASSQVARMLSPVPSPVDVVLSD